MKIISHKHLKILIFLFCGILLTFYVMGQDNNIHAGIDFEIPRVTEKAVSINPVKIFDLQKDLRISGITTAYFYNDSEALLYCDAEDITQKNILTFNLHNQTSHTIWVGKGQFRIVFWPTPKFVGLIEHTYSYEEFRMGGVSLINPEKKNDS